MRKLVYVTHPFGGNFDRLKDARWALRRICDEDIPGVLFWAPWIDVCECVKDTPALRSLGLQFDRQAIALCSGLLEIKIGTLSAGQMTERSWARAQGTPIVTANGYDDLERAAVAIANELGVT